ncbi:hypothetical protein ACFYY8_07765 [Streptosporangium sp. NPDC001559]|uniref:hypothetical protein n=1 Tax=Streptosporangium sp. NPDC001559 TaxID=3366187 RepID=UPI0036E0CB12
MEPLRLAVIVGGVFRASLKNAITQWRAEPVGFVSYGGTFGGPRATEHRKQAA